MKIMVVSSPHAFATRDVYTGHFAGLQEVFGKENVVSYDVIPRFNLFHQWTKWMEEKAGWVPRELAANVLACEPVFGAAHFHEVDIVYFISPMYFPMSIVDMLRKDGFRTAAYFTECPYEDEFWARSQASHFDTCFVNDLNSLSRFRVFNEQTHYLPHAFDPSRHHRGRGPADGHEHVVYVGTGFPSRVAFLNEVDWSGIDLRLYGNWMQLADDAVIKPFARPRLIENAFTARIYRGASIGISLHREERHWGEDDTLDPGEAFSVGPRTYELAACGLYQVSDVRPELDTIFAGDAAIDTFDSPASLERAIRWALAHPEERERRARAQCEAVQSHTVKNRMLRWAEVVAA